MIFISYASEDFQAANALADKLAADNHQVWMDKRNLVAGQDWESMIWRAATQADFFCLLVSSRSVNKRGFIRKEIRFALDKWKETLPEDSYLIPCRLEPIEPPLELRHLQYVDLFSPGGYDILRRAFKREYASAESIRFDTLTFTSSDKYTDVERKYPRFVGEEFIRLNRLIDEHNARHSDFATQFYTDEPLNLGDPTLSRSTVESNFAITFQSKKLVSLLWKNNWYGAGAAHGNYGFAVVNYDRESRRELSPQELFADQPNCLEILTAAIRFDLHKQLVLEGFQSPPEIGTLDSWIEKGAAFDWSTFGAVSIRQNGLVILFDPYSVGPFAWGTRGVLLEWPEIAEHLNDRFVSLLDGLSEAPRRDWQLW